MMIFDSKDDDEVNIVVLVCTFIAQIDLVPDPEFQSNAARSQSSTSYQQQQCSRLSRPYLKATFVLTFNLSIKIKNSIFEFSVIKLSSKEGI